MKGIVEIGKSSIGESVEIRGSIIPDDGSLPDCVFGLTNAIDGKWTVACSTGPGNMSRSELICRVSLACHAVMNSYNAGRAKIGDKFDVVEGPIAGLVAKQRKGGRS